MGQNPKYDRKMLDPEGGVTPQEQEILVRIMEEAAELQQAIAKVLRWGWHSFNPELPVEQRVFNYQAVRREHDDLQRQLGRLGDLRSYDLSEELPPLKQPVEREGSRR